jgi:hypothetical protein
MSIIYVDCRCVRVWVVQKNVVLIICWKQDNFVEIDDRITILLFCRFDELGKFDPSYAMVFLKFNM